MSYSKKQSSDLYNSSTSITEESATNRHFVHELLHPTTSRNERKTPSNVRKEVQLSFFVWNINELDVINQRFSVRFNMYASWMEEKKGIMDKMKKDLDSSLVLPNSFQKEMFPWDPQLRFVNLYQEDDTGAELWYRVFGLDGDASKPIKPCDIGQYDGDMVQVMLCRRIQGVFHEGFEMKNFPFDIQHLHIGVTSSWSHESVALSFDKKKPTNISSAAFVSQTWDMKAPRLLSYQDDWDDDSLPLLSQGSESATGARYCRAYLAMTVSRRPNFIMWNVMVIMTLVGFLSFATFALPPEELGDRQAAVLTLVLTTVAFKYVTTTMMPEISYVTMTDVVIYACMFLQGIMMLCICIAANIKDPNRIFDYSCAAFLFCGWMLILFWFAYKGVFLARERNAYFATCEKKFHILSGERKQKLSYEREKGVKPPTLEELSSRDEPAFIEA